MQTLYSVKFRCNIDYDHKAPLVELIEVDTISFLNKKRAMLFLMECTSPITKAKEIDSTYVITKRKGKKQIAL